MLIGLLAASALGMAVASSTRRTSTEALSEALFGEGVQLDLPFPPEPPEELPEGIPDLFETFEMKQTIYIIWISDGCLIGAVETEEEAVADAKSYLSTDTEIHEMSVARVQVPSHIAHTLIDEGRGAYDGGYNAYSQVAKHGGEITVVWEWSIFDEDFEGWPEELQNAHRERLADQFDIEHLPKGSLVYTSTELTERIEDEDPEDLEHLFVVRDRQSAVDTLLLPHPWPRPKDRRLLTYRMLASHLVQMVPDDEVTYAEEILGVDFDDDEDTHRRLTELNREGIDIRSIEAKGHILLRNLTNEDIELVDVQRIHVDKEPQ